MTGTSAAGCPHTRELRGLLSGDLPADRADAVEEHVEACPVCLAHLAVLPVENPVVGAIRGGLPAAAPVPPDLAPLVLRLTDLHPSRGSVRAGDDEVAGVEEVVRSLGPSAGPGEFGRLAHYRILGVLGVGGMGVVFRAEDTTLGREVALKVMRPRKRRDDTGRARFLREARAMAALRHDHIAVIHQVGEHPGADGRSVPFFAMELLSGEGLDAWKRREPRTPPGWAARVGRQAAAGLAAAHAAGLVHRDVKPANLWLEPPPDWADAPAPDRPPLAAVGRVKLLDFGLVVASAGGTGEAFGTVGYMAPEQAVGVAADARTDLFSLGCVLYELCTGELPYPVRVGPATALPPLRPVRSLAPGVPPGMAALVERMLAERPGDRPATAKEVEHELAPFDTGWPPETGANSPTRPSRRRFGWAVAATVAAVPLAAGVWELVRGTRGEKTPPDRGPVEERELARFEGVPGPVNDITFLPDGTRALTTDSGGGLRVWEVESGRLLKVHTVADRRLLGVAAFPDGTRAAVGCHDAVLVLDLTTGEQLARLPHPDEVWGAAVFAGGTRLATASLRGSAYVWDVATGRLVHELSCGKQAVWTVAVSPDGRLVATGGGGALRAQSWDYAVRVWDAATGRRLHELAEHTGDVRHLAFAPDSKTLVSGGFDGVVRVWNAATGESIREIQGHQSFVERVAVLPDGRRALSVGSGQLIRDSERVITGDIAVRLWNLTTGRALFEWAGHRGAVRTLALSPDGTRFLSGSDDRTVRVWRIP